MPEQLKFFKGIEAGLPVRGIITGALYHCTDTGNTYRGISETEMALFSTASGPVQTNGSISFNNGIASGNHSLALNNSEAIGDNSFAEGVEVLSGCYGHYVEYIDIHKDVNGVTTGGTIYLSNSIDPVIPQRGIGQIYDDFQGTYEATDDAVLSVQANGYYQWAYVAPVVSVNKNAITYEGVIEPAAYWELGEPNSGKDQQPFKFFIATQPKAGIVSIGDGTHAEGLRTFAAGDQAHAEGSGTQAIGRYAHAENFNSVAGYSAHSEGTRTQALGHYSHSEGFKTKATGLGAHSEGSNTTASGTQSHAEGGSTKAKGSQSHAEGYNTTASGHNSHAEGNSTTASGAQSHAEGYNTIASANNSHVQGKYNVEDTDKKFAHIVGNGTSANSRSNAHTLDWSGNAWFAGDVKASRAVVNNIEATDAVFDGNVYLRRNHNSALNIYNSFTSSNINNIDITSSIPEGTIYIRPTRKYNLIYTSNVAGKTGTAGDVIWEVKDDGSYVLNGTATKDSIINIYPERQAFLLPPGSYELYGMQFSYQLFDASGSMVKDATRIYAYSDTTRVAPSAITFTSEYYILVTRCCLYVKSGSVYDNVVYHPYICRKDGRESNIEIVDNQLCLEGNLITDPNDFYGIAPITFAVPASNKLNLDVANEKAYVDDVEYTDIDSSVFTKLKNIKTQNVCEYNDYDNLVVQIKDNYVLPTGSVNYTTLESGSDWLENDETNSAFIRNRTHWHEKGELLVHAIIHREVDGEFNSDGISILKHPQYGESSDCIVELNGKESFGYLSTYKSYDKMDWDDDGVIDNEGYSYGFSLLRTSAELNLEYYVAEVVGDETTFASIGSGVYPAEVKIYKASIKKLDRYYLPDNLVESSQLDNFYVTAGQSSLFKLGYYATAEGNNTAAIGNYSHAEGHYTYASGDSSHAEGYNTYAAGKYSHAEGYYTYANGERSHAEGDNTHATGKYSHAEGVDTYARGDSSHAEGYNTYATGNYSHAEGVDTYASGDSSHAEGDNTIASANNSHVQGKYNVEDTDKKFAHIVGNGTSANSRSNAHTLDWSGNAWFAGDVYVSQNNGDVTDAYDAKKLATEEYVNKSYTVVGKKDGTTLGVRATAEGYRNTASEYCSHAEGCNTTASGAYSHAEGYYTTASGEHSHAEGRETTASGVYSHAEGYVTTASSLYSHAEGYVTTASGDYSHAEGRHTTASGNHSHAEGRETTASGDNSHAEGYYTTASGYYSHAEGAENTASGSYSHAEGKCTLASGSVSHAEGFWSRATSYHSHAEGKNTEANGESSHAEGTDSKANGSHSHAEGYNTIASANNSHVQGKYNVEDTDKKYAHIVGNGTSDTKRSNAHTLDWEGNAWFKGEVYVGGTTQTNTATKVKDGVWLSPKLPKLFYGTIAPTDDFGANGDVYIMYSE